MQNVTEQNLIELADAHAAHLGITHWRMSFLARGNGQFFKRLTEGKTCTMRTALEVLDWFDAHWPADLQWPADITRPSAAKKGRAA